MIFDDIEEIDEQILRKQQELKTYIDQINKFLTIEFTTAKEIGQLRSLKKTLVMKKYHLEKED